MNRYLLSLLAVGFTIAGGCTHLAERRFLARLKDKPAPDFRLEDLHGEIVALSDLRGKSAVVSFFAYG